MKSAISFEHAFPDASATSCPTFYASIDSEPSKVSFINSYKSRTRIFLSSIGFILPPQTQIDTQLRVSSAHL